MQQSSALHKYMATPDRDVGNVGDVRGCSIFLRTGNISCIVYSFLHFCGKVAVLCAREPMEIGDICWCVRMDEFALMLLLLFHWLSLPSIRSCWERWVELRSGFFFFFFLGYSEFPESGGWKSSGSTCSNHPKYKNLDIAIRSVLSESTELLSLALAEFESCSGLYYWWERPAPEKNDELPRERSFLPRCVFYIFTLNCISKGICHYLEKTPFN